MINGAHIIIYTQDPEADRSFFNDVLGFPNVDVGDGWLIFGLPPAEAAFHPADRGEHHELYLMTDDVNELGAHLRQQNFTCEDVSDEGWGLLTKVSLPGWRKAWPLPTTSRAPREPKMTNCCVSMRDPG
jgi:catechol 2,3-dioxygenase-like lactoylglutathione lyase family enzyme